MSQRGKSASQLPTSAQVAAQGMARLRAGLKRGKGRMIDILASVRARRRWAIPAAAGIALWAAASAHADRIDNGVAVFSALDKVTARTSKFEVPLNTTAQFGALKVTPRVCYSRPPDEQPKTTSFVEVDEIQLDGQEKRIFTGWMLAESPGLNAVEQPVFDVWLTDCEKPKGTVAQQGGGTPDASGGVAAGQAPAPEEDPFAPRRRVRR